MDIFRVQTRPVADPGGRGMRDAPPLAQQFFAREKYCHDLKNTGCGKNEIKI